MALIRFYNASDTSVSAKLDDGFKANDWIVEVKDHKPQTFDDLNVPLSTLELSEKQNYNHFNQFILATERSDSNACFFKKNKRLLRRQDLGTSTPVDRDVTLAPMETMYHGSPLEVGRTPERLTNTSLSTEDLSFAAIDCRRHIYCPKLRANCKITCFSCEIELII